MRALQPQITGLVSNPNDGVQIHYEVFDPQAAKRTILFLPAWSIVHSRVWKMQVAYFARYFRVVTFDGRGNGLSERPQQVEAYADDVFAADALAVMDATHTDHAALVARKARVHHASGRGRRIPEPRRPPARRFRLAPCVCPRVLGAWRPRRVLRDPRQARDLRD